MKTKKAPKVPDVSAAAFKKDFAVSRADWFQ